MLLLFRSFSGANFAIIFKITGAKFIIISVSTKYPPFPTEFHPLQWALFPASCLIASQSVVNAYKIVSSSNICDFFH